MAPNQLSRPMLSRKRQHRIRRHSTRLPMTDDTSGWQESSSAFFLQYGAFSPPPREEQLPPLIALTPADAGEPFTAVDLACGGGSLSAAILERYPRATVHAL